MRVDWGRLPIVAPICGLALALLIAAPVEARSPSPQITTSVPEGFTDLVDDTHAELAEGLLLVDIFVDGQRRGEAIVAVADGRLEVDDPAAIAAQIPDLANAVEFETRLANGFDLSAHGVCVVRSGEGCAQPPVGRFGLIFDRAAQRLDLFRSYHFIQPLAPLTPSHPENVGLVAGLNLRGSGLESGGVSSANASLSFDLTSGWGASSAFARGAVADDGRVFLRQAGIQHFTGRHRFAAGLFLSPSSDMLSQIDLVGAEWYTTDLTAPRANTRDDTPILLFLDEDSQVDVLRGSEILLSSRIAAGPARIPTARFPDGSYSVTLRIRGTSGTVREESRFFSRANQYSQANRWHFGLQAGMTRDASRSTGQLTDEGETYLSFSATRQIGARSQVSGRIGHFSALSFTEAAYERSFDAARLRASALATSEGGYALVAQASGTLFETNLSVLMRQSDIRSRSAAFQNRSGEYLETTVNISREAPWIGGSVSAFARTLQREQTQDYHAAGMSWTRSFDLDRPGRSAAMSVSYQHSPRDDRVLFSLRFTQSGARVQASAQLNSIRSEGRSGFPDSQSDRQELRVRWNARPGAERPWSVTSRLSHDGDGTGRFGLSGQYIGPYARADAQVDQGFGDNNTLAYYGGLSATLLGSRHGFAAVSGSNARSGILIAASEEVEAAGLESVINGASRKPVSQGVAGRLLPAFQPQKVSLRPGRDSPYGVDGETVEVRAFPGNVVWVEASVFEQVTVFARIVRSTGTTLSAAFGTGDHVKLMTDDLGFLIADLKSTTQQLNFSVPDTGNCQVDLPALVDNDKRGFLDLGDLECR